MMPSNRITHAIVYSTSQFLALLRTPEELRKIARIRIVRPFSDDREFHVLPVSLPWISFPPDPEHDVCDFSSMSFVRGYNVARMKTYGRIPLDLAQEILTRVDRARIDWRGMNESTFAFVVDGFCPSESIFFRDQSNVLMGFYGDVIYVDRIDVGRTITNLQITSVGDDRFSVMALAFADGIGMVFTLKDHHCPLKDLRAITPNQSSWLKHHFSFGGDNSFLVRSLFTHHGEAGHMVAIATDRGIVIQRSGEDILLPETAGLDVVNMSVDWSAVSKDGGRLVFCGIEDGKPGFYSCDTSTLRVNRLRLGMQAPANTNATVKIRVGGGMLFLTYPRTGSTDCARIQ